MKKISTYTLMLICVLASSCVSNSTHREALNKVDSLQFIVNKLSIENDELLNGENRLFEMIEHYESIKEYINANSTIEKLKLKHPHSQLITENTIRFNEISKHAAIEQQAIDKQIADSIRMANIDKLGIWKIGNYVDVFGERTGRKYIETTISGQFSNSATSGSRLSVRIMGGGTAGVRIYFDEYCNGVEETLFEDKDDFVSVMIVSKSDKQVYYRIFNDYGLWTYKVKNKETGEVMMIEELFRKELVFNFEVTCRTNRKYYFTVDSKYYMNALIKAGFN